MNTVPISKAEQALRERYQREKQNPRCDGCRFFARSYTNGGNCRRYPPKAIDGPTEWPIVLNTDWCGEHQVDTRLIEWHSREGESDR